MPWVNIDVNVGDATVGHHCPEAWPSRCRWYPMPQMQFAVAADMLGDAPLVLERGFDRRRIPRASTSLQSVSQANHETISDTPQTIDSTGYARAVVTERKTVKCL